jgi:hypothetical protein
MFTVDRGVTLILDDKIELRGRSNNSALIRIEYGAHLIMNHGARITGNINSDTFSTSYVGGVSVQGTFSMNGGEISGNTANYYGGGVYVDASSTYSNNTNLNKTGGTIFGYSEDDSNSNVVKNSSGVVQNNRGHAVYAQGGSIRMGKDDTSGPEDNLSFRGSGTWGGAWDY